MLPPLESQYDVRMSGKFLLIYICNFHVLSNLLLIYLCKLHWNLTMFSINCILTDKNKHVLELLSSDFKGKFPSDLHMKFPCLK